MKKRATLSVLAVALSTACGQGYEPQNLEHLNDELSHTSYDEAHNQRAHFSPLCDARGYPLVGNLNTKGGTTASQFCAALDTK